MNDPSQISIRSPHTRGDPYYSATSALDDYFNPLPSHEGRPCPYPACIVPNPFQSTPLIRGETIAQGKQAVFINISIHSPHTRGDGCTRWQGAACPISIHSPHTRGDTLRGAFLRQ